MECALSGACRQVAVTEYLSRSKGDSPKVLGWLRRDANSRSIGIAQRDLFFDALDSDPSRCREAARARERQRYLCEHEAHQQGALIDALRESDYFVRSRQGLNLSTWSNKRLHAELNALADAYHLLHRENLYG